MLKNETIDNLDTHKKKTLVIETGTNWLDNIFYAKDDSKISLLKIMGKPLILYNIEKLLLQYDIDNIVLPANSSSVANLIQDNFPLIQVEESQGKDKQTGPDSVKMPMNSVVTKPKGTDNYVVRKMVYPWDILKIMHDVLNTDVTSTMISKNASIAESAIVKGPCVIEDGAAVDDFSKIIGPIYIGKNTKIGTSSLVRHSMMGDDTTIGFNCEIARTFFMGNTRVAHLDVILDSIIGQDCWLGGFVGTTNVLLNKETIRYKLDDVLVSTALDQFGSVIGYHCAIGAGTVILPGRFVPPNSTVQAGTVFSK
jgi:UDP-N-acetylglucosamine diphosphorylase / glucose-1-phosphate thymidylyltransferase / UDP-N-acetylgalactosamine diphosphorylase / glucosamine-1-phosphate N-acetyltransferase / galactosamine-1-phosphate N-acetyltransferase